jgi:hypothetical protein
MQAYSPNEPMPSTSWSLLPTGLFICILGVLNPIVLNNYFESNWLLYHWKWFDTQNYPCKLQGYSSFRFPTDNKSVFNWKETAPFKFRHMICRNKDKNKEKYPKINLFTGSIICKWTFCDTSFKLLKWIVLKLEISHWRKKNWFKKNKFCDRPSSFCPNISDRTKRIRHSLNFDSFLPVKIRL